ncbi:arginyltransferase [Chromatiaceae bacterium AAb-1]|nr:arginyltransferase [Chromatiaceae bacterium AAb-1]
MPELRFGLTATSQCSYLSHQQEQLVFLLPEQPVSAALYQQLQTLNFRRSGNQIYTPHCPACDACQSVRLQTGIFSPRGSQRRLLRKAERAGWRYQLVRHPSTAEYYKLFQQYISFKHPDGDMYPATPEQLLSMLQCSWLQVRFLEQYYQNQLVAVTIVDELADSYSAVYTFFAEHCRTYSPGKLAVLYLTRLAAENNKDYTYLGYYITDCTKMAYKAEFSPQQRYIQGQWHSFG